MIIKNYFAPPVLAISPSLDLQIIENVTDVFVHARYFSAGEIGDLNVAGITSTYGDCTAFSGQGNTSPAPTKMTRHIDFTRDGVKSRLVVTEHAYICNDRGQTVEKVST